MIRLRPLSGHEEEIVGIYWELNLENLAPATFPLPTADSIKDHTAAGGSFSLLGSAYRM
jgi:hypothetical protein